MYFRTFEVDTRICDESVSIFRAGNVQKLEFEMIMTGHH